MNVLGILPFARFILQNALKPGDIAIDCTTGNGNDTVFLSELVGENGKVYGFDIQEQAIAQTSERLARAQLSKRVSLIQKGHEHVRSVIPKDEHARIKAAIFNLGYLPGGDKSIVTQPTSTVAAISALLDMMPKGGTIVLVIYHGHKEGQEEMESVLSFTKKVDQQFAHVLKYEFINQVNNPPFVIAIEKR